MCDNEFAVVIVFLRISGSVMYSSTTLRHDTDQAQGTFAIVVLMFCSGSTALSVVANTLPAYRAIASSSRG